MAAWTVARRAAFDALKADPVRWENYVSQLSRSSKCGVEAAVWGCDAGSWERALGGARYQDVPCAVLLGEVIAAGPMPRREVATGHSSMAYL